MKKIIFSFCFLLISFTIISAEPVQAQEEDCEKSIVELIFRDAYGDFIPNINFSIHVQIDDADGQAKPGAKVASGAVSDVTGIGTVTFTSDYTDFAIKAWDENDEVGELYFYNDLTVCGGEEIVTAYLSAINVVFRNTDNELIKNQSFDLYTQGYDADGDAIKEKEDLVTTLNTGETGEKIVYVAGSNRSIDGNGTDYYIVETEGPSDGIYRAYDIRVDDEDTTDLDYIFSDIVLSLEDHMGVSFPAGEKISIYNQATDNDGESILGDLIKEIYTDDHGLAVLQYPAGIYAVRLIGENNQNLDFFDIEIFENEREEYDLSSSADWNPSQGFCETQSSLTINTKTVAGDVLEGVNYALYEQDIDINGIPTATVEIIDGQVDVLGNAVALFNPDPRKKYALKLYVHNSEIGEFWYFNELQFSCGKDIELTKNLSALKVVLRKGDNSLVKNKEFSIYTQKFDVDGFPIKEKKDLVSDEFTTSEAGVAEMYLSDDHLFNDDKRGTYVLEVMGENKKIYTEYGIKMEPITDTALDYIFSDIVIELKQANGQVMAEEELTIYSRSFDRGTYVLGEKQERLETDASGKARFALPAGFYVLKMEDSFGNEINFWNIRVADRKRTNKTVTVNTTRVSIYEGSGTAGLSEETFYIYNLKKNNEGMYERSEKIKSLKTGIGAYRDLVLASNPYLFVATNDKREYATAVYVDNRKLQEVDIRFQNDYLSEGTTKYELEKPIGDVPMYEKLAGRILLQVESLGEAWYVDAESHKRYYMKNGPTAYEMMRKFGLGISDNDLKKIPVGLDERFEEFDYDGDLVPDKMEEAIGTDMYNHDSDDDGFEDGEELLNGFDPLGKESLSFDLGLANKLKGKILLQVESRGEAWYIHPEDGKRYYMKDGESAYEIMRFLSLGITNENLEEIEAGSLAQ